MLLPWKAKIRLFSHKSKIMQGNALYLKKWMKKNLSLGSSKHKDWRKMSDHVKSANNGCWWSQCWQAFPQIYTNMPTPYRHMHSHTYILPSPISPGDQCKSTETGIFYNLALREGSSLRAGGGKHTFSKYNWLFCFFSVLGRRMEREGLCTEDKKSLQVTFVTKTNFSMSRLESGISPLCEIDAQANLMSTHKLGKTREHKDWWGTIFRFTNLYISIFKSFCVVAFIIHSEW